MSDDPWDAHADWWQREFTDGADAEYQEQILPLAIDLLSGRGRVIDIGTGEGQVARELSAAGVESVVGVDASGNQVMEAVRRGGGATYAKARADCLPVASEAFDGAIACLVFEHITEMDQAIAEVGRVLCKGGRFVLMLNHPLLQTPGSGWIDDHVLDPPEQYWRVGPYLVESIVEEEVRKGVEVTFVHRPLNRYVNAMAGVGLFIEHMIEPSPPSGFLERAPEYTEAASMPRLLVLVASKR
ncbi:MAG: class I SAM-dependent methyltransferase [Acidimicrobiales bacterium]